MEQEKWTLRIGKWRVYLLLDFERKSLAEHRIRLDKYSLLRDEELNKNLYFIN